MTSTSGDGAVLEIRDLVVVRGSGPVVRGVSLDVPAGQVTALLGPNGAGKSSLVLAVGGVLPIESGSVRLDGRALAGRRPERVRSAGVAIVPEGRRLLRGLSVRENLDVACYTLSRARGREGRDRALELFPELQKRFGVAAGLLSGGEQQMLVLAQALVSQPRVVLVDELSLGLAPVVVKRLVPAIRAVADSGVGVLLIEQFATVALGLARRVHVLDRGRIAHSGDADELRDDPSLLRSAYLQQAAGE